MDETKKSCAGSIFEPSIMSKARVSLKQKAMESSYMDTISEMERLLAKYEAMEKEMLVMDDYDGGQMDMVRLMIEDLRKLMWWTV